MRLLIDMNLAPRWVQALVSAGHDAVHGSMAGPIDATDSAICKYARQHDFVLITNDLDFPRPSVILLRGEPFVPEVRGEALLKAIAECSVELNCGAILTVDWLDRPRARLLPFEDLTNPPARKALPRPGLRRCTL